jgi:hypothetical protein
MGGDRTLPRRLRWALFAMGLGVTGGTYAATGSEGLQVLALYVLVFGVYPAMARAFGRPDELTEVLSRRNVPLDVLATSVLFLVSWGALVFFAAPDLGLGPWFWSWVVLIPWLEVYLYLAERRLRRDGADDWKPMRPTRDATLAGVATAPVITAIMLIEDASRRGPPDGPPMRVHRLPHAGTFAWMSRSSANASESGQTSEAAGRRHQ